MEKLLEIIHMDDYRHYALDESGQKVFVGAIKIEDRHQTKYYCIACGEEMIPVLGERRTKHFRHKKENPNCSLESYIHKIGKQILKERFYEQESFNITFMAEVACDSADKCVFLRGNRLLPCNSHKRIRKTIDLKKLYNTCEEEREYKGFRADLLLSHSEHPEREPVFLEIAFTHDCELQKIESGIQIIEIKVEDDNGFSISLEEDDTIKTNLSLPNPYIEELPPVRFFNFSRKICSPIPLRSFVVYTPEKDGIKRFAFFPDDNLTCQDERLQREPIFDYELLVPAEWVKEKRDFIFYCLAAAANKTQIRSCLICHHNRRGDCNRVLEYVDGNGIKTTKKCWTIDIPLDKLDREKEASKCPYFILDIWGISSMLSKYRNFPHIERIPNKPGIRLGG